MKALVVGGSAFLLIALVLAWLLVFVRILNVKPLKKIFPASGELIRAHIDYILMSLLLFAFYAIADELPMILIATMIVGGAINPFLFIVLAMRGEENAKPGPVFTAIAMISFVSATIGFGGAAILIAL